MQDQNARIKVQRSAASDLFKSLALFFPRGQAAAFLQKNTRARGTDLQTVFEAVGRRLIAAVAVLLPALAQQQGPLVQEEVALHGLEASQLLHAGGAPLVAEPHAEGALHQHAAQLTNVALPGEKKVGKFFFFISFHPDPQFGRSRR